MKSTDLFFPMDDLTSDHPLSSKPISRSTGAEFTKPTDPPISNYSQSLPIDFFKPADPTPSPKVKSPKHPVIIGFEIRK